ncbi:MAG: substrate-binding domain-containing protein [Lachnospiraceae bacterium]
MISIGKKRWVQIGLIIISILLLFGISLIYLRNYVVKEMATDPDAAVLGFVVTVTEDEWQEDVFESLKEEARSSGYEIMTIQAERNQAEQIEAIRALIVYRVDAIILFPVVDSGWDAVLIEAQEANIPVITADKGIRKSDEFVTYYVGYDYYADAAKEAALLAEQAQPEDTIIELYGTLGSYSAKEITRGFRETLTQQGLEIQSSVSGDYMRSRGKEITEGFLKSSDGVDFIISHNDAMTLGAVEAIEEQGKIPGTDVRIFAVGGGRDTIALLQEGKINCLISRSTQKLGQEIIKVVDQVMQNETLTSNFVFIETEMLTKAEVSS